MLIAEVGIAAKKKITVKKGTKKFDFISFT